MILSLKKITASTIYTVALTLALTLAVFECPVYGADFFVYSIYKGVDLGNPGESPKKDFFVNLGWEQGVKPGSILEVKRKTASFDLLTEKLFRDVQFPIARLKVIHVEKNASIARLEKMLDLNQTPTATPFAVMVGDNVRLVK